MEALTGLTAGTINHYRVKSADAAGNLATSGDFIFTTRTLLVGAETLQSTVDSNPAGMAEAFQYTAVNTGNVTKLYVYVNSGSTATQVIVGLYSNTATDDPSSLLTHATISNPVRGHGMA